MEEVRVGMVGAGFAADFHARCYAEVSGSRARIVAVTSARQQSREAFAAKHNIPSVHASLPDLLAGEEVDLIDLCVPTNMHAEYILQAARAGKHTMVEKPLTGYCGEPDTPEDELIGETVPRQQMMNTVTALTPATPSTGASPAAGRCCGRAPIPSAASSTSSRRRAWRGTEGRYVPRASSPRSGT